MRERLYHDAGPGRDTAPESCRSLPQHARRRGGRALCLLPLACLLTLLVGTVGCIARKGDTVDLLPTVESSMISRVILSPRNGQTITVPRFMADAQKLWSPLKATDTRILSAVQWEGVSAWPATLLDVTEREKTERYLARLVGSYKGTTVQALQRASGHMPILLAGLRRAGLPQELAAIPLVESAFENKAVSRAGAAGLWQLMPETARRYGLTLTPDRDERFDVAKATSAAAAYLRFLHRHFGDWALALAAYNCGEGTLRRALDRTGSVSLGEVLAKNSALPSGERVLFEETVQYVPKVVAAMAVMSQGESWGLPVAGMLPDSGPATLSASPPSLSEAKSHKGLLTVNPPMPALQYTRNMEPRGAPFTAYPASEDLPRIKREQ